MQGKVRRMWLDEFDFPWVEIVDDLNCQASCRVSTDRTTEIKLGDKISIEITTTPMR